MIVVPHSNTLHMERQKLELEHPQRKGSTNWNLHCYSSELIKEEEEEEEANHKQVPHSLN